MSRLIIRDFTCIKHADIETKSVNVVIGPQGSGKSVTTKLLYFFWDILSEILTAAEEGHSLKEFKKNTENRFCVWFNPSAWGPERFTINFQAGDYTVRVLRRKSSGRLSEQVSIIFSDWFDNTFEEAVESFAKFEKAVSDDAEKYRASNAYERTWRARESLRSSIRRSIKSEYVEYQTFIPAGRAFFTSIGRLVAGFEHAGSLDPVTLRFAKFFANLRDYSNAGMLRIGDNEALIAKRNESMSMLFGGKVSTKKDSEYIEMPDGRRIPFSALSSGQQELIPIWFFLDNIITGDFLSENRTSRRETIARQLVFIEEPEAHLFPAAQSSLMSLLVSSVVGEKNRRQLFLTTHSPYVMTKLNVFLKAGQIARRKRRNTDLGKIVPRDCWIGVDQLAAWAIIDGHVRSIVDEDSGLIDGQYLDNVSDVIAREFEDLLDLEAQI